MITSCVGVLGDDAPGQMRCYSMEPENLKSVHRLLLSEPYLLIREDGTENNSGESTASKWSVLYAPDDLQQLLDRAIDNWIQY
jgi:hypothetical protein